MSKATELERRKRSQRLVAMGHMGTQDMIKSQKDADRLDKIKRSSPEAKKKMHAAVDDFVKNADNDKTLLVEKLERMANDMVNKKFIGWAQTVQQAAEVIKQIRNNEYVEKAGEVSQSISEPQG